MSSQTVAVTVRRIRSLVRDGITRMPVFDSDEIVDAIDRVQFPILGRLPGLVGWNSSFLNLVAGTAQYTTDAQDIQVFNHFRLTLTGEQVRKVEPALFDEFRRGNPAQQGDPVVLSIIETAPDIDDGAAYIVRLWPTPARNDTLEALYANSPSTITIASTLAHAGNTIRAIEYRAAAELLAVAHPDKLLEIGADKSASRVYLAAHEELLRIESERLTSQRRTNGVVTRNPF